MNCTDYPVMDTLEFYIIEKYLHLSQCDKKIIMKINKLKLEPTINFCGILK